jgi:membrane protease YdiL (CAAX protease family)
MPGTLYSVFAFGVISALLYRATGSLGASVLLHSASNFSILLGYWLTMESPCF